MRNYCNFSSFMIYRRQWAGWSHVTSGVFLLTNELSSQTPPICYHPNLLFVCGFQLDKEAACAVPHYNELCVADVVSPAPHLAGVNPHSRHNMCQLWCWLSLGFRLNWWLKSSFDIKNRTICIAMAARGLQARVEASQNNFLKTK